MLISFRSVAPIATVSYGYERILSYDAYAVAKGYSCAVDYVSDPNGVEASWSRVDGVRVRLLRAGSAGPPVLLLHGGGFDSAAFSYRHTLAPLSRRNRVFALDWPGYGQSDKPDLDYDLSYYVRFLEKTVDALGLARASFVGLSMGGGAATGLALRCPERVDKLVLVSSYGLGTAVPYGRFGYLLARTPGVATLIYAAMRASRPLLRRGLRRVVADRRMVTRDFVEEAGRFLEEPGAGAAFRTFRNNEVGWRGLRTDFSYRLREISAPTLVVHGARDRIVPVGWASRAHERLPNSQLRILKGCGHWPPRERPEEFNRIVSGFLASRGHS